MGMTLPGMVEGSSILTTEYPDRWRKMSVGFQQYEGKWEANAQLGWNTLAMKATKGIPNRSMNVMDWGLLEEIGGHEPGSYEKNPERVYLDFQLACGACFNDQWIPENPLTMTQSGYDSSKEREATTGAEEIIRDGMKIDSPEAAAEHMEQFVFPKLAGELEEAGKYVSEKVTTLIDTQVHIQELFGMNMLKVPYSRGFQHKPCLRYRLYGYENYFMAYALFPDLMARDFKLQGDLAAKKNAIAAQAIVEGGLPRLIRLDHDMADSRGTLVDIKSLDEIWFPQFARSIQPFLDAGVRLIWHYDGNLMEMVPRLLECGLNGFQGFQYEDGMDYEKICKMTDRDGNSLLIEAGVSVTTTLPLGTKEDVVKEMKWLVENGPAVGLSLGESSSLAPNTNHENVKTLIEGLKFYRENGRG